MMNWSYWLIFGAVLMFLEVFIPGGIIVFLGLASCVVAAAIHMGWVNSVTGVLLTWFISSIVLILFLRSFFMKYFEGDSQVQNVDEDLDLEGGIVEVVESIEPYKSGRVKFRDSTWQALADEQLAEGVKAVIVKRDGNNLIVKSIE